MDRKTYNELLSTAKFKPGDLVWTDMKTYSPWPGKVLYVSDEILKTYPHGTQMMHYVELYMKKERAFLPEDELRPFDEGRAKFSLRKRTSLFHQAVFAARQEAMSTQLELSENSNMDVEKSVSFCSGSNLPAKLSSHSCNSDVRDFDMPVLKPYALSKLRQRRPSSKVSVPSKTRFKKKSRSKKMQNKDLNSQDVYEFSESDPLTLDIEKKFLGDKNATETSIKKTSCVDIKKNNSNSDQLSESSLSLKRVSIKRKGPVVETTFDSKINLDCESSNKNIDKTTSKIEPIFESKLNTQSAPFCISAEISKVRKTAAQRCGTKSKKCRHVKKSACDQTVVELASDDVPEKVLKIHYLDTNTKVLYKLNPVTTAKLNDLPNKETKVLDQADVKTNSNDEAIEEQPETSTQQKADQMMSTPPIPLLYPNPKLNVGFLGLGALGKRIVKQLLADGYGVTVWNRSFYKCHDLVENGALLKRTAEQVVDSCNITFCCVTDSAAVQEVVFSLTGALKGLQEGKSFIVLTTIDPDLSSAIEFVVKTKGGHYLEAPLFPAGGEITDNALMTVVGGSQSCLNICTPLFRSFVKDLVYIGNVPDGNKMVLLLKTLSAAKIAALAECMALADKCDVPTDILFQVFKQTQVASPFLVSKAEAMLQCKPWCKDEVFPLRHFANDLHSTMNLSNELRTPVIAATKQVFVHSKLRGFAHHDVSAVYSKYTEPF